MNSKLKVFGKIGLGIAEMIFPAVKTVEQAAKGVIALKGKDKQEAALNLILAGLEAEGQISGKELLSAETLEALRAAIDAVVHVVNLIERDHAAAAVVGA